jgi:hypothetical protein
MTDRALRTVLSLSICIAVLVSCGGGDEVLATVGDRSITEDEFRETFDRLTPEEQVRVLDPGGRMALLERIIHRTILEDVSTSSPAEDAAFWEDLYSTAWLATEWTSSVASDFDPVMDGEDSLLFSTRWSITVVLIEDSLDAADIAGEWADSGPAEPDAAMALAPWTSEGSSYVQLSGMMASMPQDFYRIFEDCAGEGVVVRPAFGAWAVGELETMQLDSAPLMDGREGSLLFGRHLASQTPVDISSSAVSSLVSAVSPGIGTYSVTLPDMADPEDVLATWEGGVLSTGEVMEIMGKVQRENFFEAVSPELTPFLPPEPRISPGVDVWFYVGRIARTKAQAGLAGDQGLTVPDHVVSAALAEAHLRQTVLVPLLDPDPDEVLGYYQEHIDDYVLPERRSVLLAYVDSTGIPLPEEVSSFDDLGEYRTMVDDEGEMMPTPLQPSDAFGELLGSAVFSAEPGVFTGPVVFPEGGLVAWFQVVEVAPPDTIPPEDIQEMIEVDFRRWRLPRDLEAYLMELWAGYSVEIDSSRVEGIDPWARTY